MVLMTIFVFFAPLLCVLSAPLSSPGDALTGIALERSGDLVDNITTTALNSTSIPTATDSLLLTPPLSSSLPSAVVSSSSSFSASTSSPPTPVLTQTVIEVFTSTTTVIDIPTTVTVTAVPSTFISSPTPNPISTTTSPTAWTAPPQMTDLSPFNISAFPGGENNLQIVQGIPATASATTFAVAAETTGDFGISIERQPDWDNSSSILQLFYPANSIDPAQKPQGGAEFYATPLHLKNVSNTTLEYSVFFPLDFDWVQAGKLPGLYGGKTGCSGGDAAVDCFSTRLMWRENGAGELYLYAPKDKQTNALCSDPQSVCDAAYGLSIGRGSFNYTAGAWTHLKQTVALNTPGKQDGGFSLIVDGKEVISRSDVFYRDDPPPPRPPAPSVTSNAETSTKTESHAVKAGKPRLPPPATTDSGGLLGGLLGGVLGIFARQSSVSADDLAPLSTSFDRWPSANPSAISTPHTRRLEVIADQESGTTTSTVTTTAVPVITLTIPASTVTTQTVLTPTLPIISLTAELSAHALPNPQPVGFTGLFFSTFFGGHEQQYATPRDQYTWFKDFAMRSNDQ